MESADRRHHRASCSWLVGSWPFRRNIRRRRRCASSKRSRNRRTRNCRQRSRGSLPSRRTWSTNQARLAAIAKELPATPDLPVYVRSLTAAAAATNVDLVSIAPGTPTVLSPVKAAAPAAPSAAAATGDAGRARRKPPHRQQPARARDGSGRRRCDRRDGASAAAAGLQTISVSHRRQRRLLRVGTVPHQAPDHAARDDRELGELGAECPARSHRVRRRRPANNAWKTIGANISLTIFEGAARRPSWLRRRRSRRPGAWRSRQSFCSD